MALDRVTGPLSEVTNVIARVMRRNSLGRFILDVGKGIQRDHLSIMAAGAAFYAFLAVLPGLAALVLVYGLVFDPSDVVEHVDLLSRFVPEAVTTLLAGELRRLVTAGSPALGLGLLGSVLAALWSSTKGVRALVEGLNIVEGTHDCRNFVSRNALALAFTACGLLLVMLALSVMIALPLLVRWLPDWLARALPLVRFLLLPVLVLVAISALYRFGSCTRHPGHWLTLGAAVATTLWFGSSWLFHKYVENVGSYSGASFGSVSTVVVFMLWLYISCYAILIGAEVDGVVRTGRGRDDPLGIEV